MEEGTSSYASELFWGNIDLICLCVLPVIIVFVVLWLCKFFNFSVLPSNMKGKKFQMPNLKRVPTSQGRTWIVDESPENNNQASSARNGLKSFFSPVFTSGVNMYD